MTPVALRVAWRAMRNAGAATPGVRGLLFRDQALAKGFGRSDAEYSWSVFRQHFSRIQPLFLAHGWPKRILEVGPGANAGTALLFWAADQPHARVTLWDGYRCLDWSQLRWSEVAAGLLAQEPEAGDEIGAAIVSRLHAVRQGSVLPQTEYRLGRMQLAQIESSSFDLVYSHAALEHVWEMDDVYRELHRLTALDGFHCHRVDLADHGRRHDDYLEMCRYSDAVWWITQRFLPGALNRWRASDHVAALERLGMTTIRLERDVRGELPAERRPLAARFRHKPEEDLRTTGLWIVAAKRQHGRFEAQAQVPACAE